VDLGYAATYVLRPPPTGRSSRPTSVKAGKLGDLQVINGTGDPAGSALRLHQEQHQRPSTSRPKREHDATRASSGPRGGKRPGRRRPSATATASRSARPLRFETPFCRDRESGYQCWDIDAIEGRVLEGLRAATAISPVAERGVDTGPGLTSSWMPTGGSGTGGLVRAGARAA